MHNRKHFCCIAWLTTEGSADPRNSFADLHLRTTGAEYFSHVQVCLHWSPSFSVTMLAFLKRYGTLQPQRFWLVSWYHNLVCFFSTNGVFRSFVMMWLLRHLNETAPNYALTLPQASEMWSLYINLAPKLGQTLSACFSISRNAYLSWLESEEPTMLLALWQWSSEEGETPCKQHCTVCDTVSANKLSPVSSASQRIER